MSIKSVLKDIIFDILTWLTDTEYLCHKWPWICSVCRNHNSWLITGFVTEVTRRVPHMEQELLTLPEHLSSPPVFSGVLVFSVMFCRSLFILSSFLFWPLCCPSFDSDYLFGIFWPLCCPSFDSDYLFGIFWPLRCPSFDSDYLFAILWPLWCPSFDTSLVSCGHCVVRLSIPLLYLKTFL